MDILEPVCVILSTVAKAIQVSQQNRNDRGEEWKSEKSFCFSLRSTLEAIRDRSPSNNGNFTHAQDLKRLTQVVLQPLTYFYNVLSPTVPSLQNACEPYASQEILARLEVQLRQSVIQPVQALRQQVYRYLQGINTLLLLYTIDAFSSRPHEVVSEQQLVELQNLRRRARAVALPDLEQLTKLFSTRTLSAGEQQRRLVSMRRDVERHWQGVQLAIQGGRSDIPDNFYDDLFEYESSNYHVQSAMYKNSNQVPGAGGLGAQKQARPPQATSRPGTGSQAHRPSPPAQTQSYGPTNNAPKTSRPGNGNTSTTNLHPQAPPPGRVSLGVGRKQVGSTGTQPIPQSAKNHGSQPRPASNPPRQKVAQSKPPAGRAQAPPPQHAPYRPQQKSQAPSTGPGRKAVPQGGGHSNNSARQAPSITNNYHTTSNSNSSYNNVDNSVYSTNSNSTELQQVNMQQSNAYLQQQNFTNYESDQPYDQQRLSDDDDYDGRYPGNRYRPEYQDNQVYQGNQGYPDNQGHQGYPQQDNSWQPPQQQQPYVETPQPTYHPENKDSGGYAPQEPMRPSSDYGKNKPNSTAAYVGAGVAGGAALGAGAAIAYGASGDNGSTNGNEGDCCGGDCCGGDCCGSDCCGGDGGGGGGGCMSGCCGDADGEENGSCCIIM